MKTTSCSTAMDVAVGGRRGSDKEVGEDAKERG